MPLVRFLPADDERIRRTVLAIADELTDDGLVLRYRTEETDDGLSGAEGSFTICSFWLVSALCEIGEITRARRLCEKLLSYASPLGLYGEELDPDTGRHLGNFPQAFTHLALINAVMHLIHAERGTSPGRARAALAAGAGRRTASGHGTARPRGEPAGGVAPTSRVPAGRAQVAHRRQCPVKPFRFLAEARAVVSGRELRKTVERRAEAIGIDTLVIPDHLIPQLAPMPTMATIAAASDRLRVAAFVLNNDLRHPAVLAQDLASIDVLSATGGWTSPSAPAGTGRSTRPSASPFDPTPVRQARLAEAITVLKGCFADGPFSFSGEHYTITEFDAHPKPVQRPHPPFLIGGGGRRTLDAGRPRGADRRPGAAHPAERRR